MCNKTILSKVNHISSLPQVFILTPTCFSKQPKMSISLEEYFRTTFEDKLLVKLPEREDEHLTPATRLLEKRREMTEVEQVAMLFYSY